MLRERLEREIARTEAELKDLKARLRRHNLDEAIRSGDTMTARVIALLESDGAERSLADINAALDPKLDAYIAVTAALRNLVKYGMVRHERRDSYKSIARRIV